MFDFSILNNLAGHDSSSSSSSSSSTSLSSTTSTSSAPTPPSRPTAENATPPPPLHEVVNRAAFVNNSTSNNSNPGNVLSFTLDLGSEGRAYAQLSRLAPEVYTHFDTVPPPPPEVHRALHDWFRHHPDAPPRPPPPPTPLQEQLQRQLQRQREQQQQEARQQHQQEWQRRRQQLQEQREREQQQQQQQQQQRQQQRMMRGGVAQREWAVRDCLPFSPHDVISTFEVVQITSNTVTDEVQLECAVCLEALFPEAVVAEAAERADEGKESAVGLFAPVDKKPAVLPSSSGPGEGTPCSSSQSGVSTSSTRASAATAPTKIVREVYCGHRFHEACILQWVTAGHYTCPLCRSPLVYE